MAKAWDGRCRKWYADRYDFRTNMVRITSCSSMLVQQVVIAGALRLQRCVLLICGQLAC
jgi:hypothetical protein